MDIPLSPLDLPLPELREFLDQGIPKLTPRTAIQTDVLVNQAVTLVKSDLMAMRSKLNGKVSAVFLQRCVDILFVVYDVENVMYPHINSLVFQCFTAMIKNHKFVPNINIVECVAWFHLPCACASITAQNCNEKILTSPAGPSAPSLERWEGMFKSCRRFYEAVRDSEDFEGKAETLIFVRNSVNDFMKLRVCKDTEWWTLLDSFVLKATKEELEALGNDLMLVAVINEYVMNPKAVPTEALMNILAKLSFNSDACREFLIHGINGYFKIARFDGASGTIVFAIWNILRNVVVSKGTQVINVQVSQVYLLMMHLHRAWKTSGFYNIRSNSMIAYLQMSVLTKIVLDSEDCARTQQLNDVLCEICSELDPNVNKRKFVTIFNTKEFIIDQCLQSNYSGVFVFGAVTALALIDNQRSLGFEEDFWQIFKENHVAQMVSNGKFGKKCDNEPDAGTRKAQELAARLVEAFRPIDLAKVLQSLKI